MALISKSPERHTFQKESYLERQAEQGKEINSEYVKMFDMWLETADKRENDPEWQKNNLEYDLRTTDWILEKVRSSPNYAKDLYAALCNTECIKIDVLPILKDEKWGCSWRHAGGIIADMLQKGDYIDWYCSGNEGHVTDEVRADLKRLGWHVISDYD